MKLQATHFIVLGKDEEGNAVSFAIDVGKLDSGFLEVITEDKTDRFEVGLHAFLHRLKKLLRSIGIFVKSTEPDRLDGEVLARVGEAAERLGGEIDNLTLPEFRAPLFRASPKG